MYFILVDSIKARVEFFQCVCTHVAALRALGSATEAPLIELAVITGVTAGFPGIYSPHEHALCWKWISHIHTHRFTHTLDSKCIMHVHILRLPY